MTKNEHKLDTVYQKHIENYRSGLKSLAIERCRIIY